MIGRDAYGEFEKHPTAALPEARALIGQPRFEPNPRRIISVFGYEDGRVDRLSREPGSYRLPNTIPRCPSRTPPKPRERAMRRRLPCECSRSVVMLAPAPRHFGTRLFSAGLMP